MREVWAGVLALTGFVACPCHLPLTLPLLLGILGGTGAGSFVASHTGLIYGIATAYFVVGLAGAVYWFNRRRRREAASCASRPPSGRHAGPELSRRVQDHRPGIVEQ